MKRVLCLSLVLTILCTLLSFTPAAAATIVKSGDCGAQGDNVKWTLDSDGVLEIHGSGRIKDYDWFTKVPWYDNSYHYPINKLIIDNGITNVCNYMLYGNGLGNKYLTKVELPNSITEIGQGAFTDCKFSSISMPDNLKAIGESAFSNCANISSISIPPGVTEIKDKAFSDCTSLKSISLPNNITKIGSNVFLNCPLDTITIPGGITTITDYMGLNECKNVIFSDGTTSIESFRSEKSCVETITLSATITEIGSFAFGDCPLKEINVNSNNRNFCSVNGVLFTKDKTKLICYPRNKDEQNYSIPNGVLEIDVGAFTNCDNLTTIKMPNSIIDIGRIAFSDCNNLTNITISNQVSKIEEATFLFCSSLNSITIPHSVKSISCC